MTRVSLWGPVILLKVLIFSLSSLPDPGLPPVSGSDKMAHFVVYALLAVLWGRALCAGSPAKVTNLRAIVAMIASALYGGLDELHQRYVPGRLADWQDLVADATGAVAGGLFVLLVARAWQRSRRRLA
jgi:VanZ family protein